MKLIIAVAFAVVAVAVAAPPTFKDVETLRSSYDLDPEGSYKFGYENSDGSVRSETGELKQVVDAENKPQTVVVIRGSYSYIDETGKPVTVEYYADENGFHAEGDVIPKSRK